MYEITVRIEKLMPFLSEGSDLTIRISNINGDEGAYKAVIDASFKEGVSGPMLGALSPMSLNLELDTILPVEGSISQDVAPAQQPREPALPHVEKEYDEIRDKVGKELGVPIQTLCGTGGFEPPVSPNPEPMIRQAMAPNPPTMQDITPPPTQPAPLPSSSEWAPAPTPLQVPVAQPQQFIPQQPTPQAQPLGPRDAQLIDMQKQMMAMKDMMTQMASGEAVPQVQEVREPVPSIMSIEELNEVIDGMGDIPEIDTSRRLTKQEAVELERYKLPKPAYVITKEEIGQLCVDDIAVALKPNLACNLSSIPLFKLKKSTDLQRALLNGWVLFINSEQARVLAETADQEAGYDVGPGHLPVYTGPDGEGIERASTRSVDVTPTAGEGAIFDRQVNAQGDNAMTSRPSAMIVNDVNESSADEQSSMLGMINSNPQQEMGMPATGEAPSAAMMASQQTRMAGTTSKIWKPLQKHGK